MSRREVEHGYNVQDQSGQVLGSTIRVTTADITS